jgi:hypothetical protein
MNPNIIETAGIVAVGSGAVLGIVVVGNIIVIYCCYRALLCFGGFLIMTEHLENLDDGHDSKNEGKPKYPLREPTKLDCLLYEPRRLLLQLIGGLRLLVGNKRVKSGNVKGLKGVNIVGMNRPVGNIPLQAINNGLDVGTHKKRTMPNEKS